MALGWVLPIYMIFKGYKRKSNKTDQQDVTGLNNDG
jgi:hypothetical protein